MIDPIHVLQSGGDMGLRMWALTMVGPYCSSVKERLDEADKLVEYVKRGLSALAQGEEGR